ncbi:MAG: M14 family metallopeptidase [Actinomycetota bacterium]
MKTTLRLLLLTAIGVVAAAVPLAAQEPPPQTGFEQRNGASWTTHDEELAFLAEIDSRSERVTVGVIGETALGRPLHLVLVGNPAPHSIEASQSQPTTMIVCTQHGNEPAGREACLKTIRDMAFTTDPVLLQQLSTETFLFVPTANPDGRAANTRGNSRGTDINRDHLPLRTEEAQAIAAVVRDWKPDLSMDLHEYGPGTPLLYDDEVLYLWPRNLNVDKQVQDLARSFAIDHLAPCAEAAGYTADEYGRDALGDFDLQQTAGDHDDAIMRNTMGLRHSLGILVETAVTPNPTNGPGEEVLDAASGAATNRRRVASHRTVVDCALEFMRDNGNEVMAATALAPVRKQGEGLAQNAPVYFSGQDEDSTIRENAPAVVYVYPPPCAYDLTPAQAEQARAALELHGIRILDNADGGLRIPMGQEAEPVIPLLLDGRGSRDLVQGTPFAAPPFDFACGWMPERPNTAATATAAGLALVVGLSALIVRRRRLSRA